MNPTLIGLAGRAGVGKDTVADIMCNARGAHRMAFADPLRAMGEALLVAAGVPLGFARERHLKEAPMPVLGVSWRRLLQTLGTEWGRETLGRSFWLDIADSKVVAALDAGASGVVITDVRFPNEASWIRSRGGRIVRVLRHVDPVADHESERQVDHMAADLTIVNNGTLDDLRAQVAQVLGVLEARRA